jgi:Uma2 family endonuclease
MLRSMFDVQDIPPARIRGLKRVEYDRLVDLGLFDGEKIELLRGQLVAMSPIGFPHTGLTVFLTRYVIERLDRAYDVSPGQPFAASDDSEPEPDLMISPHDPARRTHPEHALLVMEFSDSSIRKDRRVKLPIYAEAGVPEYWIFDLSREGEISVEVYTEPMGSDYGTKRVLRDGDVLRATQVPLEIPVSALPR